MGSKELGARSSAFRRWNRRVSKADNGFVLVIHGGATRLTREGMTLEKQVSYRSALDEALKAGYEVLKDGGEAMDAVVAAISVLEDCPLFNAGKGAVFNARGKNELEASIMLSKPPSTHPTIPAARRGTSLALLTSTRNPSQLARAIYLNPDLVPHPKITGATAEDIGSEALGIPTVDSSYFWTEAKWNSHRKGLGLPEQPIGISSEPDARWDGRKSLDSDPGYKEEAEKMDPDFMSLGTVGAVALDIRGCVASLTSTGGRTNKLPGRIGDTATMGCGLWAEEWKQTRGLFGKIRGLLKKKSSIQGVGISATGDGDYFIRQNTASTIARRMQFLREPLDKAIRKVLADITKAEGCGGVIALDRKGNVSMHLGPNYYSGMHRGVIRDDGTPLTGIFFDEELSQL